MTGRLVIEATGFGVRGAMIRDGRLVVIQDADAAGDWVTDGLFHGRVRAVDTRLNAAFVEIGLASDALLNAKDARFFTGNLERRPINRMLAEGQSLIVQGVREAAGGKGSRVTTDIKLFGFHLIWRPYGWVPEQQGPIRGREREALQARGETLFPDRGVTLRKLAGAVDDAVLAAELARLEARWQAMQSEAQARRRPGRIAADDHPLERLLRALIDGEIDRIEIADPELHARCRALLDGPLGPHGIELVRLDGRQSAFEQTEVAAELEQAMAREIPLRKGGRLIIEPTEACVAIDVDGEGRSPLELNLDAAFELARLVRLRNLGGSIIVDFVDLPMKHERQRLEQVLAKAFRGDPAPVQIYPMSPLGLVQISRSRRGRSLDQLLTRPCPACAGSGRVPSLRANAERLLGEIARAGATAVRMAPDLASFFERDGSEAWAGAVAAVTRQSDPALPAGTYVIEAGHAG